MTEEKAHKLEGKWIKTCLGSCGYNMERANCRNALVPNDCPSMQRRMVGLRLICATRGTELGQ